MFSTFSICAIIINNVRVWPACRTGFLISIKNFFRTFVITVGIDLMQLLIVGVVIAVLALGPLGTGLPTSFTIDYLTYQKIAAMPIVTLVNSIVNLFFYPMETIILTLMYLEFIKKVTYPALQAEQTTA
jgi:hypothetical protein